MGLDKSKKLIYLLYSCVDKQTFNSNTVSCTLILREGRASATWSSIGLG